MVKSFQQPLLDPQMLSDAGRLQGPAEAAEGSALIKGGKTASSPQMSPQNEQA